MSIGDDKFINRSENNNSKYSIEGVTKHIEFEHTPDLRKFLIKLYKMGHVFHGSTKSINILKPSQAYCLAKKQGNQTAIYFAANPDTALFRAICGGLDGTKTDLKSVRFNPDTQEFEYEYCRWEFSGKSANSGYVYVVPKSKVAQLKNDYGQLIDEYISKVPITPILKIKIREDQLPFEIKKV